MITPEELARGRTHPSMYKTRCVCACVHARVCVCVRECVCERMRFSVCCAHPSTHVFLP